MKPATVFMSTLFLSLVAYGSYRIITLRPASVLSESVSQPTPQPSPSPVPTPATLVESGDIQIISAVYGPPFGFAPTAFTVKAGQMVRLEVRANEDGIGCMGRLMVPQLSTQVEYFKKGQTHVIEFTPSSPGTYDITCEHGLPYASIIVE